MELPFEAKLLSGKIILSGDLDNSCHQECQKVAREAVQQASKWVIDAQKVRLLVDGEEMWSEVAQTILGDCHLIYMPSQLAQNLEYDENYNHKNSIFLEIDTDLDSYYAKN